MFKEQPYNQGVWIGIRIYVIACNLVNIIVSVASLSAFALQDMSLLEVKHGLLQISESLDFLHNNARLVHRAISPEVVIIYLHSV